MEYRMEDALAVLRRTPDTLRAMLSGLPEVWTQTDEGPGTWSPYDVVGHLIHGERAAWIPRIEHIRLHGERKEFVPFDREAMFTASQGRSLADLLDDFEKARIRSLDRLAALNLDAADFARRGIHPLYGTVSLGQLLAAWVVHDLDHLSQIVRVLARQYAEAVGPYVAYLPILKPRAR
jgi:hypothetical protein